MAETFHYARSNRLSSILCAIAFVIGGLGVLASAYLLGANLCLMIGLAIPAAMFAMDAWITLSDSGPWEVYLHQTRGGFLRTPKGYFVFTPDEFYGFYFSMGDLGDDAPTSFYLCFESGHYLLSPRGLPANKIREFLSTNFEPDVSHGSFDEMQQDFPHAIRWTAELDSCFSDVHADQ